MNVSRPPLRRPSHGTVVAYLALLVALSGTAYAAVGANSVGSSQLKPGAVRTPDLAANSVTGPKIAPNAVRSSEVSAGAIGSQELGQGAVTPGALAPGAIGGGAVAGGAIDGSHVADGALTGADLAPDSITGAGIQESTLGAVPIAQSVGGVGMSAFSAALPETASAVTLFQESALQLQFDCDATQVELLVQRTSSPAGEFVRLLKLGQGDTSVAGIFVSTSQQAIQNATSIEVFITHYQASGVVSRLDLQLVRNPNGIGTDDCFATGFVRRTG